MRLALLIALAVAVAAAFGALSESRMRRSQRETRARDLTGGDPGRGAMLARELGCVACHVIPGIRGPDTHVGPSLEDFGKHAYLAGAIENTPANLQSFLRDPRSIAPKSAMPDLRVTESQSRHLAAYLYTQR